MRSGKPFSAPSNSVSCARKGLSTLILASTTRPKTRECMDAQAVERLFISRPRSLTRAADGLHSLRGSLVPSLKLVIRMVVVWKLPAQPVEVTWATSSRARVIRIPLMQGIVSTVSH